ncbi:hypothetical protein [Ensifer sp.]|jgi:hypothetical protein|nr:hypothetical protein [Ensifer sp.]
MAENDGEGPAKPTREPAYTYGKPLPQGHDWIGVIYQFLIALKSALPKK